MPLSRKQGNSESRQNVTQIKFLQQNKGVSQTKVNCK